LPNRIIKESVNESKGLSECTFFAQDLYKRLITYADDYGRFNIDPVIMLARLYPREMDIVTTDDIYNSLTELINIKKISVYHCYVHPDDIYGLFPNWSEHQRIRNTRAKCPDVDIEVNDWYYRRFIPISLKIQAFERDKGKCTICGKNLNPIGEPAKRVLKMHTGEIHFDHIVPVILGGRATLENIRTTCPNCNQERKRKYSTKDILEELCGNSPQVAAECNEPLLESNPIRIQSEFESNPKCMPGAKASEPADTNPPVICLLLNDKTEYGVVQCDIDEWSSLYPAVDVMQELRKMKGWLDSNENRRKTRKGIKKFITNWLAREQDKGGNRQVLNRNVTPMPNPNNRFNNFPQRAYSASDYADLERKLINKGL
jgi:hypothetical protein